MLQVTEKANRMITDFLEGREGPSSIRIFLAQGGWSGPSLGMALDEPKENDEIIKDNNITYLIEKELFDSVRPINIDFIDSVMGSGFSITSSLTKANSCGSCSCS